MQKYNNRKSRQPQITCAKKKVYTTSREAVKAAFIYRQNGFKQQSPYECANCGKIHLTSMGAT